MSEFKLPLNAIKGRGAATRLAHRFARDVREAFDDDWPTTDADNGAASAVPTQVIFEDVKSAIARNDSPDIDFDFSINPYRGCETWLQLLLRPAHAQLPEPVARVGLRDEDHCQAQPRRGTSVRAGRTALPSAPAQPGLRHRLLPAGGARAAPDPRRDRGAAGDPPPVFADHQGQRRGTRPGPHCPHGRDGPGRGVRDRHHAGCAAFAPPGAARRGAPGAACARSARWRMRVCPWA
jgi:hypothetical protein